MTFRTIIDILIIFNDKKEIAARAFQEYSDIKKRLRGLFIIKIL
jgi:hypothetical protein